MNLTLELSETHLDGAALEAVCRRYGVKELSLFGSAARGEMRAESDVDIMVEFEPGARVGLIKFESLAEDLETLAGRRVDPVTRRGLRPWVRPGVLKDARVIYRGAAQLVHAYFDLDWQIRWDAATDHIPVLRSQVLNILAAEFAETESD